MPTDTLLPKQGENMRRRALNRSTDRKVFRRTSKPHSANTVKSVMRGGIRK